MVASATTEQVMAFPRCTMSIEHSLHYMLRGSNLEFACDNMSIRNLVCLQENFERLALRVDKHASVRVAGR